MATFAGYNGRVRLSNKNFKAYRYSVTTRSDLPDVTNFESAGTGQYVPGVIDADIMFEAYLDEDDTPFDTLDVTDQTGPIGPLTILPHKSEWPNLQWTFTTVLIESLDMQQDVRGKIVYTVRAKNTGFAWTAPLNF